MNYIYVLKNPVTDDIRYVGKTTNPNTRLYNHIKMVNRGKTYCKSWIKSLLKQGLKPQMEIVEFNCLDSSTRERYWINHFTKLGYNLCNHTIGGECGKVSNSHILLRESQVLKAVSLINSGIEVKKAEKESGLSSSYLYKVRNGEINFLKHIEVPYFRKLKRLKNL